MKHTFESVTNWLATFKQPDGAARYDLTRIRKGEYRLARAWSCPLYFSNLQDVVDRVNKANEVMQ